MHKIWAKCDRRALAVGVFSLSMLLFSYIGTCMLSHRWPHYQTLLALKLKLAFSITLLLPLRFDVFSKGQVRASTRCVHFCVSAPCDSSHSCTGICLKCVQPYGGWKVNPLISPWTQLALWLAEGRPGCAPSSEARGDLSKRGGQREREERRGIRD